MPVTFLNRYVSDSDRVSDFEDEDDGAPIRRCGPCSSANGSPLASGVSAPAAATGPGKGESIEQDRVGLTLK